MIDVIEVRNSAREVIGIIDTAKSVIWHSKYYDVGDFEIYAPLSDEMMMLLKVNNYITRPNNDEVGVILDIEIAFSFQDGYMITATGLFAKTILGRRLIYSLSGTVNTPSILSGNVETAVRKVVAANAISCSDARRNIAALELGPSHGLTPIIVSETGQPAQKQVSYDNLLTYTDTVLKEYGLASIVTLDRLTKKLQFSVWEGIDRSVDNTDGNEPVIFATEYDNLNSSDYAYSEKNYKNTALIGGAGEGLDRFYSLLRGTQSGLDLYEVFVNASSTNRQVKASELQNAFPTGSFVGLNFVVDGVVIATLVTDLTHEYSLSSLQSKFPTGTVSGTQFVVGGVTYATAVYGKENTYTLTATGYKAMLDVDDTDGTYKYTDAKYTDLLNQQGREQLKTTIISETFSGGINVNYGRWAFGADYNLGDIVTVQDNRIGKYINTRIIEVTEVQDENGYTVAVVFEK